MKASVIQMVSTNDTDQNLATASRLIREAKAQGATLAVLPEMFAHFGEKDAYAFAKDWTQPDGAIRTWLSSIAKEQALWIVAGTLPIVDSETQEKPTATSLILDDQGNEVNRYDKVHLFDVDVKDQQGAYRESNFYQKGNRTCVTNSPLGCIGLSVCYDLRFPELYRNLAQRGAKLWLTDDGCGDPGPERLVELQIESDVQRKANGSPKPKRKQERRADAVRRLRHERTQS